MKNLFKINTAMMLTLFLTASCSKNDDEVDVIIDQNEEPITQAEMQNRSNPYDDQGIMHIGFLNALAENGDIGSWDVGQLGKFRNGIDNWDVGQITQNDPAGDNWDVGQLTALAMKFNESNGRDFGDEARRNLSMQLEAFAGIGMFSPIDDCLWRPDRCRVVKESLAILDPSNGGTDHDRTIKFLISVRDQEAEIQADGELDKDEKKALLIMLSIARHTAGYWYNQVRESEESMGDISVNMIQLSNFGASVAMMNSDSEEVGVGIAILSAYIATGRAN